MESDSDRLLLEFVNIAISKNTSEAEYFLLQNFSEPYKTELRKLIGIIKDLLSCRK
jgi:hypothetical protein